MGGNEMRLSQPTQADCFNIQSTQSFFAVNPNNANSIQTFGMGRQFSQACKRVQRLLSMVIKRAGVLLSALFC